MNTLHISAVALLAVFICCNNAHAQSALALNEPASTTDETPAEPANVYRFHKKLPYSYNGYAIEVAASTYPLDRTRPVFRQFGNIYYDKLEHGGYSYLILARFSSDESGLQFLQNIIVPKAGKARLVHYNDGIRKIVRAD